MLQALQAEFQARMKTAADLRAKYGGDLTKFDAQDEKLYSDAIEEAGRLRDRIEVAEREQGLTEWGNQGRQAPVAVQVEEPQTYARVGKVTAFSGTTEERDRKAYGFGQWVRASILGNSQARAWCDRNGIQTREMTEGVNTAGGYTVPVQFVNDVIDLRESYGLARQSLRIRPMSTETLQVPRKASRITATWGTEAGTMTAQDTAWDMVELNAKKLYCYSSFATELGEDSVVALGNDLAQDFALGFAQAEDAALFMGDGTATYGRHKGIGAEFVALGATVANRAGQQVVAAAGGLWSAIVIGDMFGMMGKLPTYANNARTAYYCSQVFYFAVMVRLATAVGGVTMAEVMGGLSREPRFMGYPVRTTSYMPAGLGTTAVTTTVATQVLGTGLHFGDLSLAGSLGDRRNITMAQSEHVLFASDQIAVRGTERVDINVHDIGNYSATAALRVPGPVVSLINAAA